MVDIDPITGLPKDLLDFEEIAKENQKVIISTVRRRYGKMVTIVDGIDDKSIDRHDLVASSAVHDRIGAHTNPTRCRLFFSQRSSVSVVGGSHHFPTQPFAEILRDCSRLAGHTAGMGTYLSRRALPVRHGRCRHRGDA